MAYYNEKRNESAQNYKKQHQKQLALSYKKEEYESKIEPAVKQAGIGTATFIKEAVNSRIECEEIIRNSGLTVDRFEEISEFIKTAVKNEIEKRDI